MIANIVSIGIRTFYLLVMSLVCISVARSQSTPVLDSLLIILKEPTVDVSKRVTDYENVIKNYGNQGDSLKVAAYLDSLKQFCNTEKSQRGLMRYWMIRAHQSYLNNKNQSAVKLYDTALVISEALGDIGYQSNILSRISQSYFVMGRFDSARLVSHRAIVAAKESKSPGRLIRALGALGTTEQSSGNYHDAIEAYLLIDSIFRHTDYENNGQHAVTLINMGLIYNSLLEDPDKALEYLEAALPLSINVSEGLYYSTTMRIGKILLDKKHFEKADSMLTLAIKELDRVNNERNLTLAKMYYGESKILQGDDLLGEHYLLDARDKFEELSNFSGNRLVNRQLANLYSRLKKWELSEYHLKETLKYSISAGQRVGVLKQMATILAEQNKFGAAYDSLLVHTNMIDSLYEIDYQADLQELETKYQTAQKEKEIVDLKLIQSQNEIINQRTILLGTIGLITLLALSFFYFYRSRQKTKINRQLKKLDELKSKLFSDISHEFRTPLSLINGPVELLSRQLDGQPEVQHELGIVRRNTTKLNRLVDSVQNLARLDAGKMILNIRPANLHEHLKIIGASFDSMAASKKLGFTLDLNIPDQNFYYDPQHLETVLYNLLSNAFKFTSEGEIKLKAATQGDNVLIEVSDTGIGLSEAQQEKIFQRYYRVGDLQTSVEGVGIGLALAFELAKLHYGNLEVQSMPQQGSTFVLKLPITKNEYLAQGLQIGPEFLPSQPTQAFRPITTSQQDAPIHEDEQVILLVEDNPDMRQHLESLFKDEYSIIQAKDGQDGLNKAIQYIPDIIISDLMMPVMDGQDFLKAVKTDSTTSHIPFIMLTANHLEEEKIKGLAQRVDDYMTKPFSIDEIKLKVSNLVYLREQLILKYRQSDEQDLTDIAPINETETKFWTQLREVVQQNLDNTDFSAQDFAKAMFMSRMQLHRKLKALTNLSASKFLRTERLKAAKKMLQKPDAIISNVAYDVGFSSPSFFSTCFKEEFGMTPREFQK